MLSVAVFNSADYEQSFPVVNFSGQTGTSLLSVSGYNQDGDQNRSELHCHILALLYSTFTLNFIFAVFVTFATPTKIFRVLLAVKKNLKTEFNWTDQSGWKWYFFFWFTAWKVTDLSNHICSMDLCHQQISSLLTTIQCKLCWFQWSTWHKHVVSFRAWWT